MTSFVLRGQAEKLAPPGSYPREWEEELLYHQLRTVEALREYPLVINTYNTGTGKTRASLLRLFELNGQRKNVLFIAPTNALIEQHAEDIRAFVEKHELAYTVEPVRAPDITALQEQPDLDSVLRRGEALYRFIRNPREFDDKKPHGHGLVMVTNPDIFYCALYFQYTAHDQRNLAEIFIKKFDYIIVDEFHYYSNKQLASFLFVFTLFDQFGYFTDEDFERRVCLLSATPRDNVMQYLCKLFDDRFALISPDNEPADSADLTVIPALTPLKVTIKSASLSEWIEAGAGEIITWVRQMDLDGAIISSSLARINQVYAVLRRYLDETLMGRITGPEPEEARSTAGRRKLILATPTVDIGYNFAKDNKPDRQNIDFVVCDARFRDELVQRIGRAGRILGKRGVEIPSRAVVLLTEDAAQALAELDGQILERSEFAAVLVQALPAKHQLDGYIRSYAMQELIWPIYKLRQMMTEDGWRELEVLYARLCDAFAPHFRRREKSLLGYARKYEERRRWLNAAQTGKNQAPDKTEIHLYDWLIWQMPEAAVPEPAALRSWVATQWRNNQQRQEIIAFVQSQVALTQALFSFREAFQGPAIGIFDPKHLFSSETVNVYDVFHLLSHYHLSDLINAAAFRKLSGEEIPDADFYCQLLAQRDQPLSIEFALSTNLERQLFDSRWTGLPIAVTGLQLQARIPKGDVVTGGIPYPIAQALAKQPVVMLIVPPDLGYARTKFEGTEIWSRRLTVNFDATGEQVDSYLVFLGTAAFEAHAELEQVFRRWQQQRYCHQAIIL